MEDNNNNTEGDVDNTPKETRIEREEDWRNEHGQPDFAFLESLVKDGSVGALEKLRSIAEDLDVGFDSGASPEELVGRIRSKVAENGEDGFQPTN